MVSEPLRRRKFLTYFGLGAVGLGAAITAHQLVSSAKSMNPNVVTQRRDEAKTDSGSTPAGTWRLPEFTGIAAWLNSPPLTIADLQGKVVLVQFCTFACINWQHTLPYITRWHQEYADRGLQMIGIHTPEFAFERDLANVKQALTQRGIKYPIAIDNDYQMWRAYHNEYWPHLFLANHQGVLQYDHIGEGAYAETEQKIRKLLG